MGLLSLEQSRTACRLDLASYSLAVASLTLYLAFSLAGDLAWPQPWALAAWMLSGLVGWTLIEYLLHRFVLHGLPPFRAWHARHHARPTEQISSPTVMSASLFGGLVFLPGWWLAGWWPSCALTLGVLAGYLAYTVTHQAIHQRRFDSGWMRQRRRWHARHHAPGSVTRYGVTSEFWDRVFGTTRPSP
jgi:sterol desaturase/sphingolipid hydroxylase (fatty acid hydroxylase superfamily)